MLAVFKRELKAYFSSPIGFIFIGFFLLISGIFFTLNILRGGNPDYSGVLGGTFTFIFSLFMVPILTMRLLSDDMRQKTDQLLITSPVSVTGIVLGKYLAAVAVFFITLVVTLVYPLIMSFYALLGLAGWQILGTYIGFFLLGASFIALGMFFSSVTESQFIAAVVTLGVILLIWILEAIIQAVPSGTIYGVVFLGAVAAGLAALVYFSTRNALVTIATAAAGAAAVVLLFLFANGIYDGLLAKALNWFSLLKRFNDFGIGVLSLSPIVYYLSFAGAFVFLTIRMIEKRRWV